MFYDFSKFVRTLDKDSNKAKFILVEEYPSINYALIFIGKKSPTPWVAAWCPNKEKECWRQGHYFTELTDAMDYINKLLGKNKPDIKDIGNQDLEGKGYEVQWYTDDGDHSRVIQCNTIEALAQYLARSMWADPDNPTVWYNGKPWCKYEYTEVDKESY